MSSSQDSAGPLSASSIAIGLALAVGCIYLLSALWMPERGFWIYDTALKFIQVRAIAENGELSLAWAGRALDPALEFSPISRGFYALVGDDLYPAYSPVFPLLSVPFYQALGSHGLGVLPLLGALLGLFAVWRLGGLVASSPASATRVAALSVLAVAFATPLWFYALAFWEHAPAVGLSCWSVWACVRYVQAPNSRQAAITGALAGLPVYFRPESYLFALVVLAIAAWSARRRLPELLALGASCIAALVPLWAFHSLALGHPLGLHITNQGWGDANLAVYLTERLDVASRLLINLHPNKSWSIMAALPFYIALVGAWRIRAKSLDWAVPLAAWGAIASGAVIVVGQLSAPRPMHWLIASNGLFSASPLLILAFVFSDDDVPARARQARRTLLGISLGFSALYAGFIPEVNSRGIHWGCRFLLCVYPLLGVLASASIVAWWERIRPKPLALASVAVVLMMSVGFQLYSLVLLHDRKAFSAELNERVRESDAGIVVTDQWFIPVDLADLFFEKPVFFASGAQRNLLLERAATAGVRSALIVDGTFRTEPPRGSVVLSDDWLRFSAVSLMERRLPRRAPAYLRSP